MGFSARSALLIAGSLAGLFALSGCSAEASAQRTPLEGEVTAALDPRTDRLADAIAEESGSEGSIEAEASIDGRAPLVDENGNPVLGVEIPLFDPSGVAMRSFHTALRRAAMGEGQARVVVYGASHVAGDFATGTLRRMLQRQFGDAGHGFVMPAHPWPHYRHLDIRVESNHRLWEAQRVRAGTTEIGRYGLAGVSVTATSSRAYGRVIAQSASRFELFYLRQPGGGSLEVRIDDRVVGRLRTSSGQHQPDYALYTVPDGPHTFEIRPRGDGPVTVFGVAVEREVPGVVIDTLGINGARAAAQLLWDEALWAEHVRRRNPDLLVLAYGTNESGDDDQPIEIYERDLRRVVTRARATVPNASCLLIGPSDRPISNGDGTFVERPRTALIVDTQRRVAAELGCAFFDLVGFGGGPMHMVQWAASDPPWAQRDHVHYTLRGYQRLGQVLHGALLRGYDGPTLPESVVASAR